MQFYVDAAQRLFFNITGAVQDGGEHDGHAYALHDGHLYITEKPI